MKPDEVMLARMSALEERMAALEAGQAKLVKRAAPAKVQEGTSVSYPAPVNSFVMPSISELHQLVAIVQRRYPKLVPTFHDELAWFEGFSRAFAYVGSLGRGELYGKATISWWVDGCQHWCRQQGLHGGDVLASCFAAACVAQGVEHIPGDGTQGTVWTFGLKPYGVRPDNGDGWRAVLAMGIREPRLGSAAAHPVDITFAA